MGTEEIEEVSSQHIEKIVHNNGSVSRRKSVVITPPEVEKDEEEKVELTLVIQDDYSIGLESVKPVTENDNNHKLEKKRSIGASFVKGASFHLKRLATLSKKVEKVKYDKNKSPFFHALKEFKFITIIKTAGDDNGWLEVKKQFDILQINGSLHRSQFAKCIGMKKGSENFASELFDAMSRRRHIHRDSVNEAELKELWEQISDPEFDSRLRTFFDMIDKDGDGRITEKETREIISLCAATNKLSNIQNQAKEYAALIMEELDPDNAGYIMVEHLEMLLLHGSAHSTKTDSKDDLSDVLNSIKPVSRYENSPVWKRCKETIYYLQDNWKRNWILILWIVVMCVLFAYKFIQYRRKAAYEVMGHCVCMAKGAAETLKLNMAIILLPVSRNTVTWLRSKTKLGIVVPFNDNLNFHMIVGVAIAIGVGIHGIYHLACDFPSLLHANSEKYKLMEPFFGKQPTNYWHFVKSWEGVTGIIMVVLMTIAFTLASPWFRRGRAKVPKPETVECLKNLNSRRKIIGFNTLKFLQPLNRLIGFNSFWYTHHLFVIVYALLIVHGIKLYLTKEWYKKTTWMYLAIPVIIYASERLTRVLRPRIKSVKILKAVVYPGDVLGLHMSKPKGFKYKSGQYMFLNCAAVSAFEWHPFSITSAPEDDYLSVHIKDSGDWTNSLISKFSKSCLPSTNGKSGLLRVDCLLEDNKSSAPAPPKVLIDGPYGAPAQDYKQYEVVLLVGLGIGATPMISIIKDILNNFKAMDEEEGNTIEDGTSGKSTKSLKHKKTNLSNFKVKKAYLYWVAGEQGFFDWFKGVMNEVAKDDHRGVIEIHNHLTSVYEEDDARSALIAMLQSINYAKNGIDIVAGTTVKSHFARPKWRSVYEHVADNHPKTRVGVFYCGNTTPIEELRGLASEFSHKRDTKFDFHKENF